MSQSLGSISSKRKKKVAPITILIDTREQYPLDFSNFNDVEVEIGTCWPGDYTIKGWEKSIAFERKSVSDLIGTMKEGYAGRHSIRRYEARFDQELEEFERHFDRVFVMVEPDRPEVLLPFALQFMYDNPNIPAEVKAVEAHRMVADMGAGEQIGRGWFRSRIEPEKIFAFLRSLSVTYGCHVYLATSRDESAKEIVAICRKYLEARRHVIHRGKIARELATCAQTERVEQVPEQADEEESPF
jgi:ERCC4-type nuclease